jgi:nucleotide-binding universal stress UspA family protein
MLHRILAPTDGSPLSERALPLIETIARAQAAEVTLVRAIEPPAWLEYGPNVTMDAQGYEALIDVLDQDAQQNLTRLLQRLGEVKVAALTALVHGPPAAALLDYEAQIQPDLVIMATHGRTGLTRFALGSIADRMVRAGNAPVLLVRAFSPARSALETGLVPLDGSALAERALPMVETLAGKPVRRVRLLRAISTPDHRYAAMQYLERIAQRLATHGLEAEFDVRTEDPADAIRHAASGVDLVILSTHGRGGLDRFRHGSIAERAMRELPTPVLLVRAKLLSATAEPPSAAIAALL